MKGINTKLVNSGPHATRCNGIEVKTIYPPMEDAPDLIADLENGLKRRVNNRDSDDACSK